MKLAEAVLREVADFQVVHDRFQVRILSCRHVIDLLSMSSVSQHQFCVLSSETLKFPSGVTGITLSLQSCCCWHILQCCFLYVASYDCADFSLNDRSIISQI